MKRNFSTPAVSESPRSNNLKVGVKVNYTFPGLRPTDPSEDRTATVVGFEEEMVVLDDGSRVEEGCSHRSGREGSMSGNFSTSVLRCPTAKPVFIVVGSVPATCCDEDGRQKRYGSEDEAIRAILSDPWIKETPDQPIQGADCRKINRADYVKALIMGQDDALEWERMTGKALSCEAGCTTYRSVKEVA